MMIKKRMVVTAFMMIMLMSLASPFVTAVSAESIKWMDYAEGIAVGKAENKKVLLHFWAKWCDFCRMMEEETFVDKRVISYLNKNFIAVKINFDIQRKQVVKYSVRGLPNTYFLESDGDVISNLPGYIPADLFFDILRYLNTDSYVRMSFDKFRSKK